MSQKLEIDQRQDICLNIDKLMAEIQNQNSRLTIVHLKKEIVKGLKNIVK